MTYHMTGFQGNALGGDADKSLEWLRAAPESQAIVFARNWFVLLEDFLHLQRKVQHLASVLEDKVLSSMVETRATSVAAELKHRVYDLALMNAVQQQDIDCKLAVLNTLTTTIPGGEDVADILSASVQRDRRHSIAPTTRPAATG